MEHSVKKCNYCDANVPINEFEEHLQLDCSFQPIECSFCSDVHAGEDEIQHLCDHLNEYQSTEVDLLLQSHELRSKCQQIRQRIAQL